MQGVPFKLENLVTLRKFEEKTADARAHYGEADDDEWICRVSESPEEVKSLIEAGFEYVGNIHGKPMFRKRT